MPTKREREYYAMGYRDGRAGASELRDVLFPPERRSPLEMPIDLGPDPRKPKRKLSAWNKFVKANSKKPRFRMRSGKLNLKKMAVAFRRKKR